MEGHHANTSPIARGIAGVLRSGRDGSHSRNQAETHQSRAGVGPACRGDRTTRERPNESGRASAYRAVAANGKEPRLSAYYVHIDFRTPAGAVASFDGVVEASNLQGAVLQAEERAGSVAKSIGTHSTTCQALPNDGALKKGAAA
jgi:hypothetical protein